MESKEFILKKIAELEEDVNRLSCMEQAVKIVLNGGYGACGSPSFRWYDETIAEGITATGQVAIRYITKHINNFVNDESGTTDADYIVSSDTDSVTYDTIIDTDIGKIEIGKLYDLYTNESLEMEKGNKDSVRKLSKNIKSACFNGNDVLYENIEYIMRHKVNKQMYKISCYGDDILVTEDHSVIVMREGKMCSMKPSDITLTDKLIKLSGNGSYKVCDEFTILNQGYSEIFVYDIEVKNVHNFFGNNICVHNSVYFCIQKIVDKKWPDVTDKNIMTDNIDYYTENTISPYIKSKFDELTNYLNCPRNLFDMKREAIADRFMLKAKKTYIMRIYDNEGIRFSEPYFKMTGIEAIRTSYPMYCRNKMKELLKIVIDDNSKEGNDIIREKINQFKSEFMQASPSKIGTPRSVKDYFKYVDSNNMPIKGVTTPIHITAAALYNRLVKELKLSNRYEYIGAGSKIKYMYLKEGNPLNCHVIGFIDELPPEFNIDDYIDREIQFDKMFMGPMESFMIYNGWTMKQNAMLEMLGISNDALAESRVAKNTAIMNKNKKVKKERNILF